jgi:hypothetical protein
MDKIRFFPSVEAAEVVFGPSARIYGPIVNEIAPAVITVAYTFMDNSEFADILRSGTPEQAKQIYWREILSRAHMTSSASLVRTGRWIEAVVRERDEANLMGWTACCRGLLEAIGDTMDGRLNADQRRAAQNRTARKERKAATQPVTSSGVLARLDFASRTASWAATMSYRSSHLTRISSGMTKPAGAPIAPPMQGEFQSVSRFLPSLASTKLIKLASRSRRCTEGEYRFSAAICSVNFSELPFSDFCACRFVPHRCDTNRPRSRSVTA